MYAIIESGSRQYQVQPESVIEVNRLPLAEGAAYETDKVLLYEGDSKDVHIGAPYVTGATVKGKVLSHLRGKKIIVFKHKRRKNYRRTRGHRQELTRLLIESIDVARVGAANDEAVQAADAREDAAEKPTAKTVAPKKPAPRKATPKGATAERTTAKASTPKAAAGGKSRAEGKNLDED